jgi:hypothetical protein
MMVRHEFSTPPRAQGSLIAMTRAPHSPRRGKIRRSVDPTQYTPCYAYRPAESRREYLYCEGVALDRIADAVGTPAYVYSRASIEAAHRSSTARSDRCLIRYVMP